MARGVVLGTASTQRRRVGRSDPCVGGLLHNFLDIALLRWPAASLVRTLYTGPKQHHVICEGIIYTVMKPCDDTRVTYDIHFKSRLSIQD